MMEKIKRVFFTLNSKHLWIESLFSLLWTWKKTNNIKKYFGNKYRKWWKLFVRGRKTLKAGLMVCLICKKVTLVNLMKSPLIYEIKWIDTHKIDSTISSKQDNLTESREGSMRSVFEEWFLITTFWPLDKSLISIQIRWLIMLHTSSTAEAFDFKS